MCEIFGNLQNIKHHKYIIVHSVHCLFVFQYKVFSSGRSQFDIGLNLTGYNFNLL